MSESRGAIISVRRGDFIGIGRFRGYLIGSLAFYGPDDRMATKMVAAVLLGERDEDIVEMRKWFASDHDVRNDVRYAEEVWRVFAAHGMRPIVMP